MPTPLFVYGTLMVPAVFRAVTGTELFTFPALLRGYTRRCVVGKPYPVIVVEEGACVEGRLCLDVSEESLSLLDDFEGVAAGLYCRSEVTVETDEGVHVQALTYTAGPKLRVAEEGWKSGNGEQEKYLTDVVAPYLDQCRKNGAIPEASSVL